MVDTRLFAIPYICSNAMLFTFLTLPTSPELRLLLNSNDSHYKLANRYLNPAHISSPLGKICAAGKTNP
jgi:hypothetical protein